ncbi:alpha/beta hydrolase [Novosphingobium aquimarinum]|uniref:alpha/beta hydrolase n=1 Tax=Novosphingobium aquimarinum TaxID=2682494 RepID=UPI0018DC6A45|nr:alpha/beta hydrolase [Novosphingobium aquimarinum]
MLDKRAALKLPGFAEGTPQDARETFRVTQAALPPNRGARVKAIENLTIDGPAGPIPVRRYTPLGGEPVGQIFYFHGGGWVFGTLDGFDPACRELTDASGCEVLSVDYRLSPEHRFPAAHDDGRTAIAALRNPTEPLIVAGDSAGGNIAAGLALRAKAEGTPEIALQLLIYPAIDPGLTGPSHEMYGNGDHLISSADIEWFWDQFATIDVRDDPIAAPARAEDLTAMPRTIVVVAGCDPLHDEGVRYAEKLQAAGIEVTLRDHPDMTHGFFTLVDVLDRAKEEIRVVGAIIADELRR